MSQSDQFGGTFGGYSAVTDPISTTAQVLILAEIDKLKALIPNPSAAVSGLHPDFDHIMPHTAEKLRAEIDALKAAIDLSATA